MPSTMTVAELESLIADKEAESQRAVEAGDQSFDFARNEQEKAELEAQLPAARRLERAAENDAKTKLQAEAIKRVGQHVKTKEDALGKWKRDGVDVVENAVASLQAGIGAIERYGDEHDVAAAAINRTNEMLGRGGPSVPRLPRLTSVRLFREAIAAWKRDLERGGIA